MRDIKTLVKTLERRGITVATQNGHYKVMTPNGMVVLPKTPSDTRSVPNAIALLRRHGVDVRQTRGRRKGSANERELENLRRRLERVLDRQGVTVAHLARRTMAIAQDRKKPGFKTTASAEVTIARVRRGGSMGKELLDLVFAAVREAEGRLPKVAEPAEAPAEPAAVGPVRVEAAPQVVSAGLELIGSVRLFLDALEGQLRQEVEE